jgi:hypothetical protein
LATAEREVNREKLENHAIVWEPSWLLSKYGDFHITKLPQNQAHFFPQKPLCNLNIVRAASTFESILGPPRVFSHIKNGFPTIPKPTCKH